jgi:hypothetical protein
MRMENSDRMKRFLATALAIYSFGCGRESPTHALARHCIEETPRDKVTYTAFAGGTPSLRFKTCQAHFPIGEHGSELGMSAIIPIKDGMPDYLSANASIIYSVTQDGTSAMFTDVGLDGTVDRLSMTDAAGNTIRKVIGRHDRAEGQALLEKTRTGILHFYR